MATERHLRRHERLVHKMAAARGLDLDEAQLRGDLSPEALQGAVLACSGCHQPEVCAAHLARDAHAAVPDYCRNQTLFAQLTGGGA